MSSTHYYHTEIKPSRAQRALGRGQVRRVGDKKAIVLHPGAERGTWAIGWYSHGRTKVEAVMSAADLRACWCLGRVQITKADAPQT